MNLQDDFVLQESNFTYDPKNPSEVNHDVLYREGENLRVSVIVKIEIIFNISLRLRIRNKNVVTI